MKNIIKFRDIEIKKQKFYQHKEPVSIKDIDINKITVSNKVSFSKKGFKYFISYIDAKIIRPLYIFLPKMTAYRKDFDETNFMCLLIEDDEFLEKNNDIWKKIKDIHKKKFDNKPIYNKKYLKAKIKAYHRKINTNFHNNKIPKEDP